MTLWDDIYEAVQAGGAGHTEPEDYYEAVTDAAYAAATSWLRERVDAMERWKIGSASDLLYAPDVLALLAEREGDIGSGECGDCECWDDATCYQRAEREYREDPLLNVPVDATKEDIQRLLAEREDDQ